MIKNRRAHLCNADVPSGGFFPRNLRDSSTLTMATAKRLSSPSYLTFHGLQSSTPKADAIFVKFLFACRVPRDNVGHSPNTELGREFSLRPSRSCTELRRFQLRFLNKSDLVELKMSSVWSPNQRDNLRGISGTPHLHPTPWKPLCPCSQARSSRNLFLSSYRFHLCCVYFYADLHWVRGQLLLSHWMT